MPPARYRTHAWQVRLKHRPLGHPLNMFLTISMHYHSTDCSRWFRERSWSLDSHPLAFRDSLCNPLATGNRTPVLAYIEMQLLLPLFVEDGAFYLDSFAHETLVVFGTIILVCKGMDRTVYGWFLVERTSCWNFGPRAVSLRIQIARVYLGRNSRLRWSRSSMPGRQRRLRIFLCTEQELFCTISHNQV